VTPPVEPAPAQPAEPQPEPAASSPAADPEDDPVKLAALNEQIEDLRKQIEETFGGTETNMDNSKYSPEEQALAERAVQADRERRAALASAAANKQTAQELAAKIGNMSNAQIAEMPAAERDAAIATLLPLWLSGE
jgi:TolA-binding protein